MDPVRTNTLPVWKSTRSPLIAATCSDVLNRPSSCEFAQRCVRAFRRKILRGFGNRDFDGRLRLEC
ncbi:MAG: hypothetical protein CMJ65_11305 [Planctomycetaceae bacterium]|nr:hypothetical protein [Planctomycetaceae bacterium]